MFSVCFICEGMLAPCLQTCVAQGVPYASAFWILSQMMCACPLYRGAPGTSVQPHKTHFHAFCARRCQTVNLSYLDLASFRCRWADRSRWTSTTGNKKHILRLSGNNTSHILFPIFHILKTWRAIWVESLSARGHNKRWFARPFSAGRMHKGTHSCGKQAPAASDKASREMYKLDWEPRQKVWQGGGR